MTQSTQDPLNVPMDRIITKDGVDPKGSEPKGEPGSAATAGTPRIDGSHTQETIDPAERLPDEPEEQNDLA